MSFTVVNVFCRESSVFWLIKDGIGDRDCAGTSSDRGCFAIGSPSAVRSIVTTDSESGVSVVTTETGLLGSAILLVIFGKETLFFTAGLLEMSFRPLVAMGFDQHGN